MEMRKFFVTLHDDGSISWNEYEEQGDRAISHLEWSRVLKAAYSDVRDLICNTYPGCTWNEEFRLCYLQGARAFMNTIKDLY